MFSTVVISVFPICLSLRQEREGGVYPAMVVQAKPSAKAKASQSRNSHHHGTPHPRHHYSEPTLPPLVPEAVYCSLQTVEISIGACLGDGSTVCRRPRQHGRVRMIVEWQKRLLESAVSHREAPLSSQDWRGMCRFKKIL
ncbi:hypothetical protein EJ08DRAFT_194742 [Tothia fuscella]|uniref:Uncharacterized protein n=1 Tax=Tothia fuscella TaxID=1048955 RepID=A0A9P4TZT8_9PEZI|nr:hypothetical protein EJ08DRAFT_194742 [Tothia fuscella]